MYLEYFLDGIKVANFMRVRDVLYNRFVLVANTTVVVQNVAGGSFCNTL